MTVTQKDIEDLTGYPLVVDEIIENVYYFTAANGASASRQQIYILHGESPLQNLMFCVIELKNGYTVTGESRNLKMDKWDESYARKSAKEDALRKLYPLLGYYINQQFHIAIDSSSSGDKK